MKNIQDEEIFEYLSQWVQEDYWCDLAIMIEEGDLELAAESLLGSGAIDSKQDFLDPNCAVIEKEIEKLGRKFRKLSKKEQSKRYNAVFKGTHLFECEDCNHVSFVKYGNEELYKDELTECWSCGSKNVKHTKWSDK